ncbi:hypothetical protein TCAL_09419 [Tigriopus californicus]|uniref:Hexosyltransferase n=2 Tax=Tigriopus californicus TaxID=6832 RepID=A0A553NY50_TIGCA|nr:hypothetical protein TCAL_09419 [Tigriopus californicus]|eukprot:TCALIF_09419-PA protein Name:"Similar to B3GALT5 Beta-1,3-galactosyltransferase 5 (Homo sapiens)" AED:0.11 eAED:0.11 QI:0/-1/0/1/-1/1/1/0/509
MALPRRIQKYFLPILSAFVVVNFLSFFIYYSPTPVTYSLAPAYKQQDLQNKIIDKNVEGHVEKHDRSYPAAPLLVPNTNSDSTILNETIDLSNVYPQEQEDVVFSLMDNPWIHTNDGSALSKYPHTTSELRGCPFRKFQNSGVLGMLSFVTHEYTRYQLCQKSKEDWLQSNILPGTGDRGELLLKTNFVFDIRPTGHFCPNSFSAESETPDTRILFIVLSRTNRFSQRNSIRQTWGSVSQLRAQGYRLVFLVGTHTSDWGSGRGQDGESILLDSKIRDESRLHRDIVRTQAKEVGSNFALEQYVLGLAWAHRDCTLARYVTFVSDQTFVNLQKFDFLMTQEHHSAHRLYGTLMKDMKPDRNPNGKHHISEESWPWNGYPGFLDGPSLILSGDVMPRLLTAVKYTPILALENVYLTGVAALAASVMRIGIRDFFVDSVPNDEDECSFAKHGGINNVQTPEVMAHIWKDVKYVLYEKNVSCVIKAPCLAEMNGKCLISAPDHKTRRGQEKQ